MPVEDAVALLGRVFNLCRSAQTLAARLAFGLPVAPSAPEALAREILRDNVAKVCLKWPVALGMAGLSLTSDWQKSPQAVRIAVFGASGRLPRTLGALQTWMDEGRGASGVLQAIQNTFEPGEACTARLSLVDANSVFDMSPQENSVAARHAHIQLMREVETSFGRGPFWRAVAVMSDIESCLEGKLPRPETMPTGKVVVPAARGLYAIEAQTEDGIVTDFRRVTPTDHLLCRNGVLDQVLGSTCRSAIDPIASFLIDILDPCIPVTLKEAHHA